MAISETDLRERLTECFAAVFPQLNRDEITRASMTSVGAWDSLAGVTLIAVVEEEFGAQIAPEDLQQFVSFDLVLDYLRERDDVS
jgi:acyl carrier protein